ncbi:hypothetical protein JW992_04300 [candidate division KSB1 bacterium]|nr:hypothetical protein [candidate division KSB1 bacterium]
MKKYLYLVLWFCGCAIAHASDCKSELAAHYKPVADSKFLLWAAELGGSAGYFNLAPTERRYMVQKIYLGLSAEWGKHQWVGEAGYKYWNRSNTGPGLGVSQSGWSSLPQPEKRNLGLREAFYRFHHASYDLTLGLQSVSLGSGWIVDERAVGARLDWNKGVWEGSLVSAAVMSDFARMQDHCATRHVYRLLRGGRLRLVGSDWGETNFAGATLAWKAGSTMSSTKNQEEPDTEWILQDFSATVSEPRLAVKKVGLIFIQEFGRGLYEYRPFWGGWMDIRTPGGIDASVEGVFQAISQERALGYRLQLDRQWNWRNGNSSSFSLAYYGRVSIDGHSRFYPAFSNLFLGDVLRLDSPDLPVLALSIGQRFFCQASPSFRIRWIQQIEKDNLQEVDFQIGAQLWQRIRLFTTFSHITGDPLRDSVWVGQLEFFLTL